MFDTWYGLLTLLVLLAGYGLVIRSVRRQEHIPPRLEEVLRAALRDEADHAMLRTSREDR